MTERQSIAPPVATGGVFPPGLPPGVDPDSIGGPDVEPRAEEVSDNGRWRLWAVAVGSATIGGGFTTERVHIYALDTTTTDVPDRVASFSKVGDMYPRGLSRNGVGYPRNVRFDHIDNGGAGFVVAADYQEVDYALVFPSHLPPTKARLSLFDCRPT